MAEPKKVRTQSAAVEVGELIAKLQELDAAKGVERTRLADGLLQVANDTLVAEGDKGVWQATRPGNGTRAQAAEALDTTVPYVQKRISRHSGRRQSG